MNQVLSPRNFKKHDDCKVIFLCLSCVHKIINKLDRRGSAVQYWAVGCMSSCKGMDIFLSVNLEVIETILKSSFPCGVSSVWLKWFGFHYELWVQISDKISAQAMINKATHTLTHLQVVFSLKKYLFIVYK